MMNENLNEVYTDPMSYLIAFFLADMMLYTWLFSTILIHWSILLICEWLNNDKTGLNRTKTFPKHTARIRSQRFHMVPE